MLSISSSESHRDRRRWLSAGATPRGAGAVVAVAPPRGGNYSRLTRFGAASNGAGGIPTAASSGFRFRHHHRIQSEIGQRLILRSRRLTRMNEPTSSRTACRDSLPFSAGAERRSGRQSLAAHRFFVLARQDSLKRDSPAFPQIYATCPHRPDRNCLAERQRGRLEE